MKWKRLNGFVAFLSGRHHGVVILMLVLIAIVVISTGPLTATAPNPTAPNPTEFKMTEVEVFDTKLLRDGTLQLTRGQLTPCQTNPVKRADRYPDLKSDKPWYGQVRFGGSMLLKDSGMSMFFVVDESEGPDSGFDRLYLDLNLDQDLTNDSVILPMKAVPDGALPGWESKQRKVFNFVDVVFDFGPSLGKRPVRLLPRFELQEFEGKEYAVLAFVNPVARQGRIRIGSRVYDALLAQQYLITGRYDRPFTSLHLTPVDHTGTQERWWGAEYISGMRLVDGRWYSVTTTPLGQSLFVRPYEGEFGLLRVTPGGRDLSRLSIVGSLQSEVSAVPVGMWKEASGSFGAAAECQIPVGDYRPSYVTIEFGQLRIDISENYHADGLVQDRGNRPWVHGIQIRPDTPFELNFTNPPEVMFASPAKDQVYAPDDKIDVKAILIDPVLDTMIRGLAVSDASSLDPVVAIINSQGKTINEGKMPFG